MAGKQTASQTPKAGGDKEERLKAALKANLARRKAQARARKSGDAEKTGDKES